MATKTMTDLTILTELPEGSLVLVHDGNGTKTITVENLLAEHTDILEVLTYSGSGLHNGIFRGKYLGDSVTDEQWEQIEAGTFDDLWVGDYWIIDGFTYRIAGINYYYGIGDTECTTYHLVIVPDECILTSQAMNSSNTTSGAYVGSAMYTDVLPEALEIVESAFGSTHILTKREYLNNTITSGYPSAASWYDSQIELMSEPMVYGSYIMSPANYLGSTIPQLRTVSNAQLPLFALRHDLICNRASYWLRDVVSSTNFAYVYYNGLASTVGASNTRGVRPAFCIAA